MEVAYQENEVKSTKFSDGSGSVTLNRDLLKIDVSTISVLSNIYLDFKNSSNFTPYVGGGIGFTHIEYDTDFVDREDNVFAYQAGLGVDYAISNQVALGINYRYMGTADAKYSGNVTSTFGSNNIYIGMRYTF